MNFKKWPSIMPVIQALLNNMPLPRLGNRAPITVFTTLPADSPLAAIKQNIEGPNQTAVIGFIRARQVKHIEKVGKALDGIHREITGLVFAARAKRTEAHNKRTNVRPCNLDVVDYVLWGTSQHGRLPKLTIRWKGPYQIVKSLSDLSSRICTLGKRRRYMIQGSGFFGNRSFEVDEVCKEPLTF